jgi:hypothetical protein
MCVLLTALGLGFGCDEGQREITEVPTVEKPATNAEESKSQVQREKKLAASLAKLYGGRSVQWWQQRIAILSINLQRAQSGKDRSILARRLQDTQRKAILLNVPLGK